MKRPNFLVFITDQHRADFLGCYGHAIIRTPHIDAIARQGTLFERFYVASPVCMPNRASLMCGRMPSVHGVRSNGIPLSRRAVTFVELLRDAGYATALIGKSHLQNFTANPPIARPSPPPQGHHAPAAELAQAIRDPLTDEFYEQEQPGFWALPAAAVRTPFYGFGHVELVTGHGDTVGGDYMKWLLARAPNARNLIGPANALPSDYQCPQAHRTAVPPELYSTAYVGERASAYLRGLRREERDAPFFLMVSFPDPHHPFNPPGRYWDMYRPEDFPVPEAFRRNDWDPPPHVAAAFAAREEGRANLAGMTTIAVTPREAQEAQALTGGMISCIDDAIGAVVETLADCGFSDETVVMFTSDHGDHLGDHRLLLKGAEQYQSLLRVPFIWSDPQATGRIPRTNALASTIDISATVLERARVQPFAGLQGRSLLAAISGRDRAGRDCVLIQYEHQQPMLGRAGPARIHSLIHDRWRISLFEGADWGEIYDLEADPGEFVNLWGAPAHLSTRSMLLERLALAQIEAVDRVPLPTRRA